MILFNLISSRYLANYLVYKIRNPQFKIKYGNITTYIISSALYNNSLITTPLLSNILSLYIGYTLTQEFTRNLIGASIYNTDLEYIAMLYSLLIIDHLSLSSLYISIIYILYSDNREDLKCYLIDNLDNNNSNQLKAQLERIL